MQPSNEGSVPATTNIDTAHDEADYERKAKHLRAFIQHATGIDVDSFPEAVLDRVDILARTAAILGLDEVSLPAFSAALSKLSSDQLQAQLSLIKLRRAEEELRTAIALNRHRQGVVASWSVSTQDLRGETASLERQKRSMAAKAKEYQQELSAITAESSAEGNDLPSITSLLALQENLRRRERDLKAQKARLKAFEGLPPNLDLAKLELASARENQIRLMDIREKLLGRMTQGLN